MIHLKRALISVSDKTGIIELARKLAEAGYELISTGGTASTLEQAGLTVTTVENVTGFPECMDGRLKTLHPRIFGGLLSIRDNEGHCHAMSTHGIEAIDILVVNLYPFQKAVEEVTEGLDEIKEMEKTEAVHGEVPVEIIEQIDIGGLALIRAAAKNYKYVTVVTSPADYAELAQRVLSTGQNDNKKIDESYRLNLAAKAFRYTAAYDAYIAGYLSEITGQTLPEKLTLTFNKHSDMRYGENPHQSAAYYRRTGIKSKGIESAHILHGKALSFNNIADAHAALELAREFPKQIVCVAVKHATPCGVAIGKTLLDAYTAAHDCDAMAIFGGIVCVNQEVDAHTAQKMHEIFLEIIIAPSFCAEALEILRQKKNIRLLSLTGLARKSDRDINLSNSTNLTKKHAFEFKSVGDGLLIQDVDNTNIEEEPLVTVTNVAPTTKQIADLIFAMKVAKHVKSNAIVVAKDGQTIGIGGGEVSRFNAAVSALERAGDKSQGAVVASDAMIPFTDVVNACVLGGISAIIQPGGSRNDQVVIDFCNEHGIAMIHTGVRHFAH